MNKIPSRDEFTTLHAIAKAAHDSGGFSKTSSTLAGILCIVLYSREIGIGPMEALTGGMNNIQGKITMSPELMNRLIRENGHKVEILDCTRELCRIKGTRRDTAESYIAEYSLDEARKAGLIRSGGPWDKYPADMLFARCISRLRRRLFADVGGRAYTTGELDDDASVTELTAETAGILAIEAPEGAQVDPALMAEIEHQIINEKTKASLRIACERLKNEHPQLRILIHKRCTAHAEALPEDEAKNPEPDSEIPAPAH